MSAQVGFRIGAIHTEEGGMSIRKWTREGEVKLVLAFFKEEPAHSPGRGERLVLEYNKIFGPPIPPREKMPRKRPR